MSKPVTLKLIALKKWYWRSLRQHVCRVLFDFCLCILGDWGWSGGFGKFGFGVVKAGISKPAVTGRKWVAFDLSVSVSWRIDLFATENTQTFLVCRCTLLRKADPYHEKSESYKSIFNTNLLWPAQLKWPGTAALRYTAEQGIILNIQQKSLYQCRNLNVTFIFSVPWLCAEFFLPTPSYCFEQYNNLLYIFSELNLNNFGKCSKIYWLDEALFFLN